MTKHTFAAGKETLAGETISANSEAKPQILVLHGAGQADRNRAKPLIERVARETGRDTFLFDFSGHGESTGMLATSSLKKRVDEANAAWQFLATDQPITVFGFSMGGHIALEMLKHHNVESLILFYPGIYTQEAFELPFDQGFSNAIRKENSWRDAGVLDILKKFKGNLLIVWGDKDEVVPRGVVDLIYESAENAKNKELYVLPGLEHLLLPKLYADAALMDDVVKKVTRSVQ